MARERDPYGWALCNVRRKLKAGAYAGGDPLIITDLARELHLSPTPVREALAHLAGEGLIEDRRGRGYYAWRLDAPALSELYDLHALVVGAALNRLTTEGGVTPEIVTAGSDRTETVLEALVRASGARTLAALFNAIAIRLGPVRAVEAQVLGDLDEESARLAQALHTRRWTALAEAIAAYHDRRRGRVADIATALHKKSQINQSIYRI